MMVDLIILVLYYDINYVLEIILCFVHPIFRFWFLVTFGDEVMKTQKYYAIFVYILQGKMGKTEKTERKSRN